MVKWFCAKVFSIVDWSRDLPIMMKWFCAKVCSIVDHFTMMDRSRDLSTIEKTFAKERIMHLQSIFHYGDFINAAIRECLISSWGQFWERVLLKHKCILSIARVPKAGVLLIICTSA